MVPEVASDAHWTKSLFEGLGKDSWDVSAPWRALGLPEPALFLCYSTILCHVTAWLGNAPLPSSSAWLPLPPKMPLNDPHGHFFPHGSHPGLYVNPRVLHPSSQ